MGGSSNQNNENTDSGLGVAACVEATKKALSTGRLNVLVRELSKRINCKFKIYAENSNHSSKLNEDSPGQLSFVEAGQFNFSNSESSSSSSISSQTSELPIIVRQCVKDGVEGNARAFFSDPKSITLCANRLHSEKDVTDVMVHEFVHAYDFLVLKKDLTDCEQLACSEIRANRDGECYSKYAEQDNKGMYFVQKLMKYKERTCTLNSAIRATQSFFPEKAEKCVKTVFEECFQNRIPFASRGLKSTKNEAK
eukprot:GSMAST32.ASY1.ANO1.2222.1 assembled CDS